MIPVCNVCNTDTTYITYNLSYCDPSPCSSWKGKLLPSARVGLYWSRAGHKKLSGVCPFRTFGVCVFPGISVLYDLKQIIIYDLGAAVPLHHCTLKRSRLLVRGKGADAWFVRSEHSVFEYGLKFPLTGCPTASVGLRGKAPIRRLRC